MQLSHRDVQLDFFLYYQHLIKELNSGEFLWAICDIIACTILYGRDGWPIPLRKGVRPVDQWYQTLTAMIAFATLIVLILQFAYNMTKK